MLKDSEKEYERIVNASYALKKGEISGDDFNRIKVYACWWMKKGYPRALI